LASPSPKAGRGRSTVGQGAEPFKGVKQASGGSQEMVPAAAAGPSAADWLSPEQGGDGQTPAPGPAQRGSGKPEMVAVDSGPGAAPACTSSLSRPNSSNPRSAALPIAPWPGETAWRIHRPAPEQLDQWIANGDRPLAIGASNRAAADQLISGKVVLQRKLVPITLGNGLGGVTGSDSRRGTLWITT